METTLLSLHALEATYGSDSEVVKSAREALKRLLKWTVQKLDTAYDGDVTYQVRMFRVLVYQGFMNYDLGFRVLGFGLLRVKALGFRF